jgi:hypothetical protein
VFPSPSDHQLVFERPIFRLLQQDEASAFRDLRIVDERKSLASLLFCEREHVLPNVLQKYAQNGREVIL